MHTPNGQPGDDGVGARELHNEVRAEQLRLIFAHMAPGTPIGLAFSFVLVAYLYPEVSGLTLFIWLAGRMAIALPRMAQAYWFRSHGEPYSGEFERAALLLVAIDGSWWGFGCAWIAQGPPDVVAIVVASVAAIPLMIATGAGS